jgi:hypothetical protein
MEHPGPGELLESLERRYFEMHHLASRARADLEEGCEDAQLRARLEAAEREKCAILARIAQVEDGLLDDDSP